MNMKRICVATGNRAEEGLLQPVITKIQNHPDMDLNFYKVPGHKYLPEFLRDAESHFKMYKPDIVIIPCDRSEMLMTSIAAFIANIPIIHFHAGDINPKRSTYDTVIRHMISLMASCWLCDGKIATKNINALLKSIKRDTDIKNVHNVGSTAFDDMVIDNSLVPNIPYDFVLYHPPTFMPETIPVEIDEIERLINENPDRHIFWGYPNSDEPGSKAIISRIKRAEIVFRGRITVFKNIPRAQFLGFMRSCSRFIGNSSSMIYEAPKFLSKKQIIQIGDRNAGRIYDGIKEGASEKIIKILEVINFDKV